MRDQTWWYVARSGGIVAWALAALAVIWGLQLSTRLVRKPAPAWVLDLHRFLGGLAVVFVGVHLFGLALDSFIGFGPAELFVPFASSYKPTEVALGVVAMYLLVAVEVTSLLMKRMPRRVWHGVHYASYAVFVLGTMHGLLAGTDRSNVVFQWGCLIVSGIVLYMTLVRILAPKRASRGRSAAGRAGTAS
ncbi:MAG: ferric reductase-like transmembrane domain-containing protein [Acidimicrobiia bacterium]|nr:ferric reductase-like transmembrane domain-containing protein [Acidimicrobiia bacterium]